jgi:hypothetical protein
LSLAASGIRRKNVLVVHNVENLAKARRSTLDHVYCFERYAPQHNYIYHRVMLPVTEVLRSTAWDAVIFESTSLGIVTLRPRSRFQHLREAWRFLRDSPAVKLVFPQDDATHSAYLDYFCSFIGADTVFSVRPERKEQLYPLTSARAEFVSTVAGYIDDASLGEISALARPFAERRWEVGQRVTHYPAWGGRFARRKGEVALRLQQACRERGLPENISIDPTDVLVGDDWYRFLGDCRFVVGAEAGHGIWDPHGAIQDDVNDYVARHPDASFEEIEDACFLGLDGRETFPGFAPRILEAALLGCGQVLLEGAYRGFVQPGVHYIELKRDYSNIEDVFAQMANTESVREVVAATRRDLVDNPFFRYSHLVERTFDVIERKQPRLTLDAGPVDIATVRAKHRLQLTAAIVADLRQEGFRGDALLERAATVLQGQEAHPGTERAETAQTFDWASVILPEARAWRGDGGLDQAQGGSAAVAVADRSVARLALVEAQAVTYLEALVDASAATAGASEAGGDHDTLARLSKALQAARLWAEALEGEVADFAKLARALGVDEPTQHLLEAVYTMRSEISVSGASEDLATLVRTFPHGTVLPKILAVLSRNKATLERSEIGDSLISIIEASPAELRSVRNILKSIGSSHDEQTLHRVAQVVKLLMRRPSVWKAIDALGRFVRR